MPAKKEKRKNNPRRDIFFMSTAERSCRKIEDFPIRYWRYLNPLAKSNFPPCKPLRGYSSVTCGATCLAAARSRCGSESPPGSHSTPHRRFATFQGSLTMPQTRHEVPYKLKFVQQRNRNSSPTQKFPAPPHCDIFFTQAVLQ